MCNHEYSNGYCLTCGEAHENHEYSNGFCQVCGVTEAPQLVDDVYQIANAGNLIWFGNYVNLGYNSVNAKLVADIDLNNREWTPIKRFIGSFDGAGHTISNYLVSKITYGDAELGFFESIFAPAVIKNLKISGLVKATTYGYSPKIIGGVAARSGNDGMSNGGTVTGVISSVKIQSVAGISIAHVGGVVGAMYGGEVSGCLYNGNISYNGSSITELGGIVGYAQACTIKNCGNLTDIYSAFNHAGGIVGYTNNENTNIINCFNFAYVSSVSAGYVGGIVGRLRAHGTVTGNYYNSDEISSGYGPSSDGNISNVEIMKKSTSQFESGQIAYLLNQAQSDVVWKQTIGEHKYPVFEGETVYYHTGNECSAYTNTADGSHYLKSDNCKCCDFVTVLLSSERVICKFDASATFLVDGENIEYQWYATNSQNLEDSVIIRGATAKTVLPVELLAKRNQETVYKYIYCVATKQVNGETVTETSPLCLNAFNQITEADAAYIDFTNNIIYTDSTENINNFSDIVNVEADIQPEVSWTPSFSYGDSVKAYGTGSQFVIGADSHNSTSFTVIVYGDINGDGVVDALDGAAFANVSNGLSTFEGVYQTAADIDESGAVDVFDYQAVVNKIVA